VDDWDLKRFEDGIKERKLRLSYFFQNIKKYVLSIWTISLILFLISIALFLFILIPNLFHQMPMIGEMGERPFILELSGNVQVKLAGNDSASPSYAPGAIIEIGGYKTTTDFNGSYHITFISKEKSQIPVMISWNNRTFIRRVTFDSGQFDKREWIILYDK
jgi:hypothetical protein